MKIDMRIRVALLIFALNFIGSAQTRMSVEQLVKFVRSSIQLKQDDKTVSEYVKKIKLSDHLELRTVEELQGQGLGPKTVQALRELSEASATLPSAPAPAPVAVVVQIPPPSMDEQKRVLAAATDHALN